MKRPMTRIPGRVLALLFLLLAVAPLTARAQEETTPAASLERYRRAVAEAMTLLQADPPRLADARQALSDIDAATLANGEPVLLAPLLGDPDMPVDVETARLRLQTVATQLDAAGADRTAERIAVLEEVLAGLDFQRRLSWLDQLRHWLANLFERLAPETQPDVAPGPLSESMAQVAGWIVIGGAAALLLFLLVRWLQTLLQAFVRNEQGATQTGDLMPTTPAEARQAASRYAQGGDYRSAVRQLYLAALLTLQDRRIVPRDPSLTNREVLARTPDDHPSHKPLQSVVEVFDDVWYGVHEPDGDTFERYRRAVDTLEQNAPEARTTTKGASR